MKAKAFIVAHRGRTTGTDQENTLEHFERACAAGVDMIEFDVRRTKDQLVVFHNSHVAGAPLSSLTHAQLVERSGVEVPNLTQVLKLAHGRVGINVDLKEADCLNEVIEQLNRYCATDRVILSSLIDEALIRSRELAPHIETALILGKLRPRPYVRTRLQELWPLVRLRACRPDYVMINRHLARLGALRRVSEAGFAVMVWAPNSRPLLQRYLADERVAGIITDEPLLAQKISNE